MLLRTFIFLLINFGGLAVGGWLMNSGPTSEWYLNLDQAPWTPPGWVFGVAWTTIMICFSIYLAKLFTEKPDKYIGVLFMIQLILNVSWNYIFFNRHWIEAGLVGIISLTVIVFIFFGRYNKGVMRSFRLLLLPYMIWLLIATSLNGYISIFN